jgi:glycosidase
MGEVWEDASNKIAYGRRCRYFVDGCLDSVMNYPFRTAILNFLRRTDAGEALKETVMTIWENYPRDVVLSNMNLLGTHDTMRILTALTSHFDGSRAENAAHALSHHQYAEGVQLLRAATLLQYTLPGSPSIYYGDEAGMEGCKDPFNRRTYPWGKENPLLMHHFRQLAALRQAESALRLGDIQFFRADGGALGFTRSHNGRRIHICVNMGRSNWVLPGRKILLQHNLQTHSREQLVLAPMGWCVLEGK